MNTVIEIPARQDSAKDFTLPEGLPIVRLQLTLRLLEDTMLPAFKGAMLRGGFGYAFQRSTCPPTCWEKPSDCPIQEICAYRWVFETPHPPHIDHFHDLRDVPRPFVIEPPKDLRTTFTAGEALTFRLTLFGRGIDYLPYFLWSFEQLGRVGIGRMRTHARLERAEALLPWQPTGVVVYQDGRMVTDVTRLPLLDAATILSHARDLRSDLRLHLHTPLRIKRPRDRKEQPPSEHIHRPKEQADWITTIDLPVIVRALCWRLTALATFHGTGPWPVDQRALVEAARHVPVEHMRVRWVDWERTSTRKEQPGSMHLGGIIGEATLRNLHPDLRALLLMGSIIHVGKACVFGHGEYTLGSV